MLRLGAALIAIALIVGATTIIHERATAKASTTLQPVLVVDTLITRIESTLARKEIRYVDRPTDHTIGEYLTLTESMPVAL